MESGRRRYIRPLMAIVAQQGEPVIPGRDVSARLTYCPSFLANKNVLNIGSASRRLNKERSCKLVQKNLSCAHECSMRRWTVKSSEIEKIS